MTIKDMPYYYSKDGVDRILITGSKVALSGDIIKNFDLTPGVLNPIKTIDHKGVLVGRSIDGNNSVFNTKAGANLYSIDGNSIPIPESYYFNVINIKDKEGKTLSKVHTKFDRTKDNINDIQEFKAFLFQNGYGSALLDKYEVKHFGPVDTHAYLSHGLRTKTSGLAMSFTKQDRNETLDLVASCYTGPAQIRLLSSFFRSFRDAIKLFNRPVDGSVSDYNTVMNIVNSELVRLLKEREPSEFNYIDLDGANGILGPQKEEVVNLSMIAYKSNAQHGVSTITFSSRQNLSAYAYFLSSYGLRYTYYDIDNDKWYITSRNAIVLAIAREMGFDDMNLGGVPESYKNDSEIAIYLGKLPYRPVAYRSNEYALPGVRTYISRKGNLFPVLAGYQMANIIDSSTSSNTVYESIDSDSFSVVQAYLMMTHENKPLIVVEQDFVVDVIYGSVLTSDFLTVMEESDVNAITKASDRATAVKSIQQFRNIISKYPRSSFAVTRYCNKGLYEGYRNPDYMNLASAASEWVAANGKDFNDMVFHMDEANEVSVYTAKKRYQTLYNKAVVDKNFLFQQKMSYFRTGEQGARAVIDPNGNFVPIILISGALFNSFVSTVDGVKTIDHGNVVISSDQPLFKFDTNDVEVGFTSGNVFTEIVAFDERFNIYEALSIYNYTYSSSSTGKSVFAGLTEKIIAAKANAAVSESQRLKMSKNDYWNFGDGSIGTISVISQGWAIDENDIIRLVKANKYLVNKGIPTLHDGNINDLYTEFSADTDEKKGIVLTALMMKLEYQQIVDLVTNLTELFSLKPYDEANPAWPYMWSYQLDGNGTSSSIKEDLKADGFTEAEISAIYPELMTDLQSRHFALEERYFGGHPSLALSSVVENAIFTTKVACEKTASLSDSLCGFMLPFIPKYK